MLNERESRMLDMIERGLCAEEHRFVEAFRATTAGRERQRRLPARALVAFGILLVVLGVMTDTGGLFLQGLLFGTAGVAWSRWRKRQAALASPGGDPAQ